MIKARIVDIKRMAIHDGDGIRTTVFFKGCSLKCVWCHNPESIGFKTQLSYIKKKCIGCGECVKVCESGAHIIENGNHVFHREKCTGCGKCEEVCLGEALKLYGKEMAVSELMPILLEDKDFYENSGGGVTLSGGECLMQADFCTELLKELKNNQIHTAVDTCGFVSREAIDKVMPYTDIFLYDVKAFDETVHIKCTGQSNKIILENLRYIDRCGKKIEIRIPYVPDYNSVEIEEIARFLSGLKNVTKVKVLPYHNYAGSKYEALGMENTLPEKIPDKEVIDKVEKLMRVVGL
ncbi:MAG: glycyl-radical enzyme activating protein [Lachnospiraceae bacterium]|nr:glycyl-radical enzyme activating protein [Lachnospiraceae bacterium]